MIPAIGPAFAAVVGSMGYPGSTRIPWGHLAAFTFMASLGILLCRHRSGSWRSSALRQEFALCPIAVAAFMPIENRSVLGLR